MTPKSEGLPALAILIVGVAVSVASFIFLDNLEDEKARAQFAVVVEQRSDDLEKSLSHTLESVVSLSALYYMRLPNSSIARNFQDLQE
ncbi:MAG: hypothetical protein VCD66_05610 [Alphaproteobacteria bacterium]